MMVRGQFFQLMASGLHDLFVHFLDLKQRDEEYTYLANVESSDAAFEDEVEFSGLGPMLVKQEGTAVQYQDIIQGGAKRYLHTPWALGIRASWELIKDDQYKLINQAPKCLARSAHFVREMQFFNLFNLGFTTVLTQDGVSLFNTSHPLLGGVQATNIGPGVAGVISAAGTYPNRPATDVDLSFTAIQLAINQFERMIDSQGLPIVSRPKYLVIPPELKWIAREILGSPHKPYTADNEINSLIKEDLMYFVGHYLTGASPWYLVGEKDTHTMKFINREPLEEDFADDFDTRSVKQIATMRFSTGVTNWIGTWGSNGP
jgi:phage major head subunit gpT-like protein